MAILFFHSGAFAIIPSVIDVEKDATMQSQPVNNNEANLQKQQLELFTSLPGKDYETLKGKKLNFFTALK